jgi:uncharacterized protein DUF6502
MSDTARAHLIHAFRKVLRPLVKILIRAGVRYDEFSEVIKGVFIESAIRDGLGRAGPLTRSRVALVTGITRSDVDRFVDNESLLAPPPPTHATTLTEVLHLWNTDPRYLGPFGVPLEIDFDSTPGRCFLDLVMRVDASADAAYILEELVRTGVVVPSGNYLKVISRSYVIADLMSPQALEYFGNTLASLAQTLEYNMSQSPDGKRLQRSVIADRGFPKAEIRDFDAFLKVRVQQMLTDVDDWIGQRTAKWDVDDAECIATGLTAFHYVENTTTSEPTLAEVIGKSPE